jgi:hypothetical protein
MAMRDAGADRRRRQRKRKAGEQRARKAVPQQALPARQTSTAWTLSVPQAGRKYYGLGRNASYEAAATGQIPTIKVNKLLRVPVHVIERMLGGPSVAAE